LKPQLNLFNDNLLDLESIQKRVGFEWTGALQNEFNSFYMRTIINELSKYKYYPEPEDLFKLYKMLPPKKVKMVILSQSPYANGQADGLAFSSKRGLTRPLSVIQNVLNTNLIDLSSWVEQGIWLQNIIMTCRPNKSLAHQNLGWERFVSHTLQTISNSNHHLIWWLWGKSAIKMKKFARPTHLVITDPHPVNKNQEFWDVSESLKKIKRYCNVYYNETEFKF
jgi:uracil-DNA glycosylase